MNRRDWKEYKWTGPDRVIPGIGHAKTGEFISMPTVLADQFHKVGWLKKPKKTDGDSGSKTVKLSDNVGIGDSGQ